MNESDVATLRDREQEVKELIELIELAYSVIKVRKERSNLKREADELEQSLTGVERRADERSRGVAIGQEDSEAASQTTEAASKNAKDLLTKKDKESKIIQKLGQLTVEIDDIISNEIDNLKALYSFFRQIEVDDRIDRKDEIKLSLEGIEKSESNLKIIEQNSKDLMKATKRIAKKIDKLDRQQRGLHKKMMKAYEQEKKNGYDFKDDEAMESKINGTIFHYQRLREDQFGYLENDCLDLLHNMSSLERKFSGDLGVSLDLIDQDDFTDFDQGIDALIGIKEEQLTEVKRLEAKSAKLMRLLQIEKQKLIDFIHLLDLANESAIANLVKSRFSI